MFKTTHNMMKCIVRITPRTPLLVAAGKTMDVTRPDIEFIRINTAQGETVYVPGSSLKGVLRGGMEALLTERENLEPPVCLTSETMCHDNKAHKEKKVNNKLPYKHHCAVCRLFGSGDMAARLEISDVFPYKLDDPADDKRDKIQKIKGLMSTRSGIKIDRKTGKTKPGALFQYEILGGGQLFAEFTFTNYELHQPGLLFSLLDLSAQGFLRYGHSKSRGLGVLDFHVDSVTVIQTGKTDPKTLKGIGTVKKYKDRGLYAGAEDVIALEGDVDVQDQVLYSVFNISHKAALQSLINQLKTKTAALIA